MFPFVLVLIYDPELYIIKQELVLVQTPEWRCKAVIAYVIASFGDLALLGMAMCLVQVGKV